MWSNLHCLRSNYSDPSLHLIVLRGNVLYHHNTNSDGPELLLIVPMTLRSPLPRELHDAPKAGHHGVSRAYDRVRPQSFWSGLYHLAFLPTTLSLYDVPTAEDHMPLMNQHMPISVPWLGPHGSSQIPTSNLDALAADGVILNSLYAQPSCTPSRSALMSGRYPIRTGLPLNAGEPWGLPEDVRILPQYLKELGYETHLVGKWHLGYYKTSVTPTYRGFDSFYGYYNGEEDYYTHSLTYQNRTGLDFWFGTEPRWSDDGKYSSTLYTQRAQYLIRNRKKPLFLVLSHQTPHGSGGPEPLQAPQENVEKFPYIGEERRTLFAGMIDALDQSVGEVFETLEEAGMLENIVVLFTSDNGGTPFGDHSSRSFNWPLRGTKMSVWEGSTRVPAFVWSTLIKRKRRVSNQLMHFTDWFTTLYSVAGGDTARLGDVDGVDMWQHLSYGSHAPRAELLYNIDPVYPAELSVAAIRNSRYKLVIDATGVNYHRYETPGGRLPYADLYRLLAQSKTARVLRKLYKTKNLRFPRRWRQRATLTCGKGTEENFSANDTVFLFDIEKDPCELNNLAKERPEIVSDFMKRLDAYRSVAVPARNLPYDPASSPENHNRTWAPWMD
ncbi:arylsulfatase B-like [Dermacentor andersoni]|uniref:arylsulfatase B-like n=1 Tax=Dermacentor andersoni TaxID=34620 RepID=UPI002416D2F7|nr:arylsulfatase B-like [Dermacentor andersoni]